MFPRYIRTQSCHGFRGFTLTELLVVIGIIAVLAALLLPTFQKMRAQAAKSQCTNNQRQIVVAMLAYAADNQGRLPDVINTDGTNYSGLWYNTIAEYVKLPANKTPGNEYLRCAAARATTEFPNANYPSYGINYAGGKQRVFSYLSSFSDDINNGKWPGSQRLINLSNSTILIADAYDPRNPESTLFYSPLDANYPLDQDRDGDGVKDSSSNLPAPRRFNCIEPRHGNTFICTMADGSARALTIKEWAQTPAYWGPAQ